METIKVPTRAHTSGDVAGVEKEDKKENKEKLV